MQSPRTFWALVILAVTGGIATGFAVPLAASFEPKQLFVTHSLPQRKVAGLEIPDEPTVTSYDVDRDSEVERLSARNRRLEVLLAALRHKKTRR